jgi:hypothetical protein
MKAAILIMVLACGCVGGGTDEDERNPPGYVCTVSGYTCVQGGCVDLVKRNQRVCSTSPEWEICDREGLSDCRVECEQVAEECR